MTLKLLNNVVWIEIPASDKFNLLIRNRYFPPQLLTIKISEQNLNKCRYRVIMLGEFNISNYDWIRPRKPKLTAVGIRCTDHATPSIR
jgi:hypothetical protein